MFGIQKEHLDVIEDTLIRWEKSSNGLTPKPSILFIEAFWKDVADQIGWAPFTIAMHFFRHKYG